MFLKILKFIINRGGKVKVDAIKAAPADPRISVIA